MRNSGFGVLEDRSGPRALIAGVEGGRVPPRLGKDEIRKWTVHIPGETAARVFRLPMNRSRE